MVEVTPDVERAISKFIANAKLEGARLALEAAADRAYAKCAETRHVTLGDACRQSIRALDPAKIVGEG